MKSGNTYFSGLIFILICCGCATQKISTATTQTGKEPIAFPGAEGFGKYTTGGRGGKVFIVSNLNDAGPGSFREAAQSRVARLIVFSVSGTIHLTSKLNIAGNVTIAGQSAPGDGICLADQPVIINGDNVIIRYLRFRMGDKYQRGGMVDGNGSDDALSATRRKNIIIDHCSMSWSTDEVFSVYAGDSTTLQWNMISEPLNYSYHFEKGDKDYEQHGFGGIWGGRHLSAHHNLFAHCNNRNPRFDGIRNTAEENVDYCNNVIYNWGGNSIYAGEGGSYNIVDNYFKYGPSTNKNVRFRIVSPGKWEEPVIPYGKFYVRGNYVDGSPGITANNHLGVEMGNRGTAADKATALIERPIASIAVPPQSAVDAYEAVMRFAGASFKRDTLDQRIISNVQNRTGALIDVQGGYPHGTAYELTLNAWPALQSVPAPADSDKDGMPDDWENKHGLNSSHAADALRYTLSKFYTNVEVYLNDLIK